MAARKKDGLGHQLLSLGLISEQHITNFLSQQYRIPTIALEEYTIQASVLQLVPWELCESHRLIPVSRIGASLVVAMADPLDTTAIDALRAHTDFNIEPVIASKPDIAIAIRRYYER